MWEVMTAYVIMHNMIVEDERDESIHETMTKGRNFKVIFFRIFKMSWLPCI
jgi:hypothetical protein